MARIEQRYQGSFTLLAHKGKGGDLARKIQRTIYGWLVRSENRLYGSAGCFLTKDFYENCRIESRRRGVSRVVTSSHYSDEEAAWCMRYVHDDSQHSSVDWVTECGVRLKKSTDELIVSVMLTTTTTGEYLLGETVDAEWQVSVPRFVKEMMVLDLIKSISMSGISIPIAFALPDIRRKERFVHPWMNWVRTESEARLVANIIEKPKRRFAVVLVMGESALSKNEAKVLATGLCGKSYVCLVSADWRVAQCFKKYDIPFERVRLILPFHTRKKEKLSRHPLYSLSPDDSQSVERNRVLESQAGYVTTFEEGAIYRQEDILSLNRFSEFKKKNIAFKEAVAARQVSDKDARDMLAYAESIQHDYETEKDRADRLEKDRDEWKALVSETEDENRREINSLKANYEGQLRQRKQQRPLPCAFPENVVGLREWVVLLDNLVVDEGAWKGMADRDKPDKVALAWKMLWHLNSTMHKLFFDEQGVDIRKVFKERSSYSYTADENDDVKKKWPEGHKATIEGKTFMCWRHIKRGNSDKELVRIYFDFDTDRNRIVISWIGRHLRTNLTSEQ